LAGDLDRAGDFEVEAFLVVVAFLVAAFFVVVVALVAFLVVVVDFLAFLAAGDLERAGDFDFDLDAVVVAFVFLARDGPGDLDLPLAGDFDLEAERTLVLPFLVVERPRDGDLEVDALALETFAAFDALACFAFTALVDVDEDAFDLAFTEARFAVPKAVSSS